MIVRPTDRSIVIWSANRSFWFVDVYLYEVETPDLVDAWLADQRVRWPDVGYEVVAAGRRTAVRVTGTLEAVHAYVVDHEQREAPRER